MKIEIHVRRGFIAVLLSLLMCSMGFSALHQIPMGTPVIDGTASIGEWDGATWIDANVPYTGAGYVKFDSNDVPYAQWTAKWSPTTNLIYVCVKVIDTQHVFTDGYSTGVASDYVVVSVDANDSKSIANEFLKYTHMQAWIFGLNTVGTGGVWTNRGNGVPATPFPAGDVDSYAATVNGSLLTYEIAVKPYWFYDDVNGVKLTKTLNSGNTVGLDVFIGEKTANTFGFCSNNNTTGKVSIASTLTQHTLVNTACSSFVKADLNSDCAVNFADIALFGAKWLNDTTALLQPKYVSDPAFTGTWSSGLSYAWTRWWSSTVGSTVSAEFTTNSFLGNGIRYTAIPWSNGGIAKFSIDGVYQPAFDCNTWSTNASVNYMITKDITGIADGDHVVTVTVPTPITTGRNTVNFINFEPLNPSARILSGKWGGYANTLTGDKNVATGDINDAPLGGQVKFTFTGTAFKWYGQSYWNSGYANVWIDVDSNDPNVATAQNVDLYAQPDNKIWTWTSPTLTSGTHTVKIRTTKYAHNPASTSNWINFTRFEAIQ